MMSKKLTRISSQSLFFVFLTFRLFSYFFILFSILLLFNRFACFWPKGCQRGSLRKSHQNGCYLKTSNVKKLSSHKDSNLQPLNYRSTAPPLELESLRLELERLQVRIVWEDNFFALLVSNSRRSGGLSYASALVACGLKARETIKYKNSGLRTSKHHN